MTTHIQNIVATAASAAKQYAEDLINELITQAAEAVSDDYLDVSEAIDEIVKDLNDRMLDHLTRTCTCQLTNAVEHAIGVELRNRITHYRFEAETRDAIKLIVENT